MKLQIKPIYYNSKACFFIQREKYFFSWRYWSDVCDLNGETLIVEPEKLQEVISHLMKIQEL